MQKPLDELYEPERAEVEDSWIEWKNFDESQLYSGSDYSGFSTVNEDTRGGEYLDQAVVGESDEEYIFMSRSTDSILECERDKVQLLYVEDDSKTLL